MPSTGKRSGVRFNWCDSSRRARELAAVFMRNLSRDYISHGEIQAGRALDGCNWSPDLAKVVQSEFAVIHRRRMKKLAYATFGEEIVAVAVIGFERRAQIPFLVIEDLVVAKSRRSNGIGERFLAWIETWARREGLRYAFLESGVRNSAAHRFFHRRGFETCSVVMVKDLTRSAVQ